MADDHKRIKQIGNLHWPLPQRLIDWGNALVENFQAIKGEALNTVAVVTIEDHCCVTTVRWLWDTLKIPVQHFTVFAFWDHAARAADF